MDTDSETHKCTHISPHTHSHAHTYTRHIHTHTHTQFTCGFTSSNTVYGMCCPVLSDTSFLLAVY